MNNTDTHSTGQNFKGIKLIQEEELERFAQLQQYAYAGVNTGTKDERLQLVENYSPLFHADECSFIGYYISDVLVACAIVYEFTLNYRGTLVKATGIGSVAVDLLHKKEGLAKQLIGHWMTSSKEKGAVVATLYPFNPAFYQNFGFGFGTPLNVYQVPPLHFSGRGDKSLLQWANLTEVGDQEAIARCYHRVFSSQHGMMARSGPDMTRLMRQKNLRALKVVEETSNDITGYLIFDQRGTSPTNFLSQTLNIIEMQATSPTALAAIAAFLHSQADQVDYVNLHTFDPYWYHQLLDLTYASSPQLMPLINHKVADMGLGMMWHVLDPQTLLSNLSSGTTPPNHPTLAFHLTDPYSKVTSIYLLGERDENTVDIHCTPADFSSILIGALPLKVALKYGKVALYQRGAQLAQNQAMAMATALDCTWSLESPQCITRF